jgi:putative FmdB family regulatory protein
MPVYTYRCQSCGLQLEKTQNFDEAASTRCPKCHKAKLQRLIQPSAIVFKGSGWYSTDHRSATAQAASRKDQDGSDKSESAADKANNQPADKPVKPDGVADHGERRPRPSGPRDRGSRNSQPKQPLA